MRVGIALCAALALVAVAAGSTAQDATLGDPITVMGVEVRGFRTRTADRPLPRIQHRAGVRIAVGVDTPSRASEGTRRTIRVCDTDVALTELAVRGTSSSRSVSPHDPLEHQIAPARPATTYVRVAIPRTSHGRARVVTIEWAVPTARREAMRALEEAFFASIRCAPAA